MAKGFVINQRGIEEFTQALQREFDKRPIHVPVLGANFEAAQYPVEATINNYHGPVVTVHGDNAQLAWGNETVDQQHNHVDDIAPGFEELAAQVATILASLPSLGLAEEEQAEVKSQGEQLLKEVTKKTPDVGIIRRSIVMIKGLLAAVASGIREGISQESADAARSVIKGLGETLPLG